jgi:hypothetical protein
MMTSTELLAIARKGRPNVRYAVNTTDDSIAAWSESESRWVRVAGKMITGEWCDVPFEILINGEPMAATWIE